jgi:hypothetical protein
MFSNAYEFEHVAMCGKLNVQANILDNYVRDVYNCTQVYYHSSIPFEISKTSLGTQIMLPSQFLEFLEQI